MTWNPLYPTASVWLHILFGDDGGGGHLSGQGIEGKTEFPAHWIISRIESALVMAQLQISHRGEKLEIGQNFEFVDGIILCVFMTRNERDELELQSAYPIRGNGVFRNINGERISKPLLRQDRRK